MVQRKKYTATIFFTRHSSLRKPASGTLIETKLSVLLPLLPPAGISRDAAWGSSRSDADALLKAKTEYGDCRNRPLSCNEVDKLNLD